MKKNLIILIVLVFVAFSGVIIYSKKNDEVTIQPESGTTEESQMDAEPEKDASKLTEAYLVDNSWSGPSATLHFGVPNYVKQIPHTETDCQPEGEFKIINSEVIVTLTKCNSTEIDPPSIINLDFVENGNDILYKEYLVDQNEVIYFNGSSAFSKGVKKMATINDKGYEVEITNENLIVSGNIFLYKEPSEASGYYVYSEFDGRNITASLISHSIAKIELEGNTWYLIAPINLVMGDLKYKAADGTVLEENVSSLPYTWVMIK